MWTFHAMNTEVAVAAPRLTEAAEQAFAREVATMFDVTERRFSRFRPDSELSALNRASGAVAVSAEMLEVLRAAREHVNASGGLFDPAIGAALIAAGYDRSFVPGALDRDDASAPPPPARFTELVIDAATACVQRPLALLIDLGGFLKGRTVDRAAAAAPRDAMIDAGGDAVVRGDGPEGDGWLVDVEDPADPDHVLVTLRLRDRAVATSAPNRRRWRTGSRFAHHLIDPRTGTPASSTLAQVTVVARSAERAEVLAKVAFLRGARDGARLLAEDLDVGGVLVARDGTLQVVGAVEVVDA